MAEQLRDAIDIGCDDGAASLTSFDESEAKGLTTRGKDEDVRRDHVWARVCLHAFEVDARSGRRRSGLRFKEKAFWTFADKVEVRIRDFSQHSFKGGDELGDALAMHHAGDCCDGRMMQRDGRRRSRQAMRSDKAIEYDADAIARDTSRGDGARVGVAHGENASGQMPQTDGAVMNVMHMRDDRDAEQFRPRGNEQKAAAHMAMDDLRTNGAQQAQQREGVQQSACGTGLAY